MAETLVERSEAKSGTRERKLQLISTIQKKVPGGKSRGEDDLQLGSRIGPVDTKR